MKFRPCIDLHDGKVKQIVGGTLSENPAELVTRFSAENSPEWFSAKYRKDNVEGGHVIKLGGGNDEAARRALSGWPGGMQIGGGITAKNAAEWLEAGASAVIATSYVFKDGLLNIDRLKKLSTSVGKSRLVLDLSCRKKDGRYWIVTDRWQKFTHIEISSENLETLSKYCFEFLIHAVDVEGKCQGIASDLVKILGAWGNLPMTYAGGIRSVEDIETIARLGNRSIDFTVGSALDLFGGNQLKYEQMVDRNRVDRP